MASRHKLSGMQKQVLGLYRNFLRAARKKAPEERCKIESVVSAEFRHNARDVDRKNFLYIEYLMRRGKRQLEQLESSSTVSLSMFNVTNYVSLSFEQSKNMHRSRVQGFNNAAFFLEEASGSVEQDPVKEQAIHIVVQERSLMQCGFCGKPIEACTQDWLRSRIQASSWSPWNCLKLPQLLWDREETQLGSAIKTRLL